LAQNEESGLLGGEAGSGGGLGAYSLEKIIGPFGRAGGNGRIATEPRRQE
jgi:hypothetical protein